MQRELRKRKSDGQFIKPGVEKTVLNDITNAPPRLIEYIEETRVCFICRQNCRNITKADVDTSHDDEATALKKIKRRPEDDIFITDFTVYDHCQHICKLDSGLIENDVPLFVSGRLMTNEHKPSSNRPVRDIGPINEWYVEGFVQKEESVIYIETETSQYVLLKPSRAFEKYSNELYEKVSLSTKIVEFLRENQAASYKELIEHISKFNVTRTKTILSEDMLLRHAQFVCDQIVNLEFAVNKQSALDEGTVYISLPSILSLIELTGVIPQKDKAKIRKVLENKQNITITSVVRKCFDTFFNNNTCISFSENGNAENMAKNKSLKNNSFVKLSRNLNTGIKWMGEPISSNGKNHFPTILLGNQTISTGDFIVNHSHGNNKTIIKVALIWRGDNPNIGYLHGPRYISGNDTLLGETSDPNELFLVDTCSNILICELIKVIKVATPRNSSGNGYFCRKKYSKVMAKFEDLPIEQTKTKIDVCDSCARRALEINYHIPIVTGQNKEMYKEYKTWSSLQLMGSKLKHGSGIFFTTNSNKTSNIYSVGCIVNILNKDTNPNGIHLLIKKMLRPSEVNRQTQHLNEVYWSEEEEVIHISQVEKVCHLVYKENIPKSMLIDDWYEINRNNIFFSKAIDKKQMKVKEVSKWGRTIGNHENNEDKEKSPKPLRTLDLFSGCGGLSHGLIKAGTADCIWAIELDKSAAVAYKLNHNNCNVINDECNIVLQDIFSGHTERPGGTKLPIKGEVELICGGPPCQGFSGLNRFSDSDYSVCKNSLILSFLSYCEYYRPKYIILENVKNFLLYRKGLMMKLTMKCLIELGYQCSYSVMQAGNFGVPQSRRRVILLAAAPGLHLPSYPDATHIFPGKKGFSTDNKQIYEPNNYAKKSAPYQPITISDAISDLPPITHENNAFKMPYKSKPLTSYQRLMRHGNNEILVDHVCKSLSPLIVKRIEHIPLKEGADWRDLPNISVKLSDGTKTQVLKYNYKVKIQEKSKNTTAAGVCACFIGKECDPNDQQSKTLIPWSVVHTAAKNNNWAGVYGRLAWNGFFPTTITNADPMGKLGRVLHPQQNRVVSVRECARSQGFPDSFLFHGKLSEKYKQIGNAVPPPLATAIGLEINKALIRNTSKSLVNENMINEKRSHS